MTTSMPAYPPRSDRATTGVGSNRQGYDHGNFIQYGYTPGRVFLIVKGRSEHEMRPPGLGVSDDVIGKIAFSYSYHSD
jgi:hypothetical protein